MVIRSSSFRMVGLAAVALAILFAMYWRLEGSSSVKAVGTTAVAAGGDHSCAKNAAGALKCWGDNTYGQLGDSGSCGTTCALPQAVVGFESSGAASISAGTGHTCALTTGGGVRCWGDNFYGQVGNSTMDPYTVTPQIVTGMSSGAAIAVSAGQGHSCAVTTGGGVKCWGENNHGQLGNCSTSDENSPQTVYADDTCSGALTGVTAVGAGFHHTCALLSGGTVKCWGQNSSGQLGDTTTTERTSPVSVSSLSGVSSIAVGSSHTCAVTFPGFGAKCWGNGDFGELGDGLIADSSSPVDVSGLTSGVAIIVAGYTHSCALTTSYAVKCWGSGVSGQHGTGFSGSNAYVPVNSLLTSGIAAVSAANGSHTCAVTQAGSVKCWGRNAAGQLGNGTTSGSGCFCIATPTNVTGLSTGAEGVAAGYYHSCVVTLAQAVKCWGANDHRQLGNNSMDFSAVPVDVSGVSALTVTAGSFHTCVLTTGGAVNCWGENSSGQLGNNSTADSYVPVVPTGLGSGVAAVAAGGNNTCALTSGGGVKCWGDNSSGQLGYGSTGGYEDEPVSVSTLLTGGAAIALGSSHTCAVTTGGTARCWGSNASGQIGVGATGGQYDSPQNVSGLLTGVASVAAGGSHSCALLGDGGIKCWGNDAKGQVGNGTDPGGGTPQFVSGFLSGGSGGAIAAGANQTCTITFGDELKCWGQNDAGQLGDGTKLDRNVPTNVYNLQGGVAAVALGAKHSCAVKGAGSVLCWGTNNIGQIGDGTTKERLYPQTVVGFAAKVVPPGPTSTPTPTATPGGSDTDGDGCPDADEQQTAPGSELSGGRRDYLNQNDYFNPSHDGVNRVDDILLVVKQYFMDLLLPAPPPDSPNLDYRHDTDRTLVGPLAWNLGAPNGLQRVDDILNIVKQYFHDCA